MYKDKDKIFYNEDKFSINRNRKFQKYIQPTKGKRNNYASYTRQSLRHSSSA